VTTLGIRLPGFWCRLAGLAALAAALLHAEPATAVPIYFDGPSGFGMSQSRADAASAAGIPTISPTNFRTGSSLGISIPDPTVLTYSVQTSPSFANPNTARSRWTINHTGSSLQGVWMVFLQPVDYTPAGGTPVHYDPTQIGLDITSGDWAIVPLNTNGTQYYYAARRLGTLDASATVEINHLLAGTVIRQGNLLRLPRHQVSFLIDVPEAAPSGLLGVLVLGLFLWRRSLV
jgi:hypothetical protein